MKRDKRRNDTKSIRKTRKASRRSIVQSLACLVVFCTTYALILPAITLERPTYCGIKEHTHSDKCYTMQLVCGQEEGEGHTHDDSCYTEHQNLICGLEESEGHTHTDECYQTYDNLICELEENEEHTHGPECYEQVTELVCPLEETEGHTHTEACYETVRELSCTLEESKGHTHTEKCYEKVLTCKKEEHEHSLQCYADPKADLETQAQWEETLPKKEELTGVWAEDLLKVAESQLDYKESDRNYQVVDEEPMGYTRYGAYLGMPYEDWCAMFIEFCLHYADIPKEDMPRASSCSKWEKLLTKNDMFLKAEDGRPEPGDLVFFDIDEYEGPDHVGIVTEVDEKDGIKTIEGNCGNKVAHREYKWDDKTLYGYGLLPENPNPEGTEKTAEEEAPQATVEFTAETETMTVRVEAPEGAFPEGTTMEVKNVAAEDVMDAVTDAVDGEIAHVDAVDITFYHEGKEIEPALPIQVFMQPKENNQEGTPKILHLQNDGTTEPVENKADSENSEETVQFEADSFSVYALVYTVDFHWEVDGKTYELSLPGGSYVSLEQLFEALAASEKKNEAEVPQENALALNDVEVSTETKKFTAEVETVEFTDPSLLWVGKIENDTTVGTLKEAQHLDVQYSADLTEEQIAAMDAQTLAAGDWALISLQAFDTEEYLTVTMKNGDQFKILVTDDQENPYGLDGQKFSILAKKGNTTYYLNNEVSSGNSNCLRGYIVNNGTTQGTEWTFEWTGEGKKYLVHDNNNNNYIVIEDNRVRLADRETALANPITVVSKEGIYSFINNNNHALNIFGNEGFGSWPYSETNNDFKMTLQKPSNISKPGTIATADTSGILQINLFDYGPEDKLDDVTNHIKQNNGDNNARPYSQGLNSHQLKFYSYGTTGTGINNFTGGTDVRPGIVADQLGTDNYPYLNTENSDVSTAESLGYLFGAGDSNVTPKTGLNHLFTLDENGYYHYDSNDNYAYLEGSDFTVYSKTFKEEGADNFFYGVGFFPFNEYDERKTCIHGKNFNWGKTSTCNQCQGYYNHHFGMSLTGNFIMPPEGQYNGKDVTYEFSGDDDMWVYIDGVLILDIGGIHNPASGSINFTTGEVKVNGEQQTNLKEKYKQVTGKDWDDSDFSSHDFRVFYMERGGMYSNLELTFNMPLTPQTPTGEFSFDKVSSADESLKLPNAEFTLFTESDCMEQHQFALAGVPVKAVSDANGKVSFKNIPYGTYYMKETRYPEGYYPKSPEEIYTVMVDALGSTITSSSGEAITVVTNTPLGYLQIHKIVTYNGVAPTTDAQKQALADTYTFKVYTNADCTTLYTTPQGNTITLTIEIGNDGVAKSSEVVQLPAGEYWIKEENPTQSGVTPEANNIRVLVQAGSTTDHPSVAEFTNNKTSDNNPDEMAIDVEKIFEGIDASKIPGNFCAVLNYNSVSDGPSSVTLAPKTEGNVTFEKSKDGKTWHWHVIRIPTDAKDFTISEQNFTISGYNRETFINGGTDNIEDPGTPQPVYEIVPEIDEDSLNPFRDYTTSDSMKVFTVTEDQILLVRMTSHATTIVSQKSLSKATRTAIEQMLDKNQNKVPGDNKQAFWEPTYVYFSKELHGSEFSYGGRTIYFDGDKVKIPHNSSSQEVRVDIVYSSSFGNNSIVLENKYTELPIEIEILKVDKNDVSKKLPDAVFTLRQLADVAPSEGGTIPTETGTTPRDSIKTDANGHTSFDGLTHGYYELTEKTPPKGYMNASDVIAYFEVVDGKVKWLVKGEGKPSTWDEKKSTDSGELTSFTPAVVADPEHNVTGTNAIFTVENESGIELPHTGGRGTQMFTFSGLILMAAVTLLYGYSLRRRRKGGR